MTKRKHWKSKEKPAHDDQLSTGDGKRSSQSGSTSEGWLFGVHAVRAALKNPKRRIRRVLATESARDKLDGIENPVAAIPSIEVVGRPDIDARVGPDIVHQGVALLADPLEETAIEDIIHATKGSTGTVLVVLDQATDPRNIGAVLRSAAAFGCACVILPERRSPGTTGTLAKSAAGALETVPIVHVTNLARALETLKKEGFWCIGLDGHADTTITDQNWSGNTVLVLGAEGSGLRRLTKETCDSLVSIPISGIESLNLSNAAAVALYEIRRK